MSRIDARIREMQFLARLDREGSIDILSQVEGGPRQDSPERQMIVSLLHDGYLNGLDTVGGFWREREIAKHAQEMHATLIKDQLSSVAFAGGVVVAISHKGRVRLSELEQQLKTGRGHDPTGLCLAKRHLMTDLAIAITSAGRETPLSVAFFDMNGLKAINDTHGHQAGDESIRAYLEAVVTTFEEYGEAYRGEGGDEVVVVLPGVADELAGKLLGTFVRQLGKVAIVLGNARVAVRLTAACGSVSTTDPNEDAAVLLKRADDVQYRAKAEARRRTPRLSTIAVANGEMTTHAPDSSA